MNNVAKFLSFGKVIMFTVSIIGRPNVGKSTLFNRMTGTKHALVHDMPGVTRDRREGHVSFSGMEFTIIDTAGLEEAGAGSMQSRMMNQTDMAVKQSDVCLLVIDGRAGVNAMDQHFARWLRKKNKPIILVVNKCEGSRGDEAYAEAIKIGFKDICAVSAEHNEGMGDLYEGIRAYYKKAGKQESLEDLANEEKDLQITILGRPNTGKSTLINKLYGQERVLTGPEAGLTRDSIAIDWEFEGKSIRLIDTAGMRRKANVVQKLEKMSVSDTLRALRYAHVAVLLLDATQALEKQDLSIGDLIIREGRSLVIGLNKWDLIEDKKEALEEIKYKLDKFLPQVKGVPLVTLSALKGQNINEIIKAGLRQYEIWNKRVSTRKLNEWIKSVESQHTPPLGKNNRRIRLKYITQGNIRPPTFTLFTNLPEDLPDSYKKYLINSLREAFGMEGVPIRMMLRKSDNPYK